MQRAVSTNAQGVPRCRPLTGEQGPVMKAGPRSRFVLTRWSEGKMIDNMGGQQGARKQRCLEETRVGQLFQTSVRRDLPKL